MRNWTRSHSSTSRPYSVGTEWSMCPMGTAGSWLRVLVAGWIETTEQFEGGADLGQSGGRVGAVGGE